MARKHCPKKTSDPSAAAKRERFVREYLIDRNATQAAIRAGYSAKTAGSQGSRMLKDPKIIQLVQEHAGTLAERLEMTTQQIAEHLAKIVTADPNELIEYRRECCRYCWGEDFKFQHTLNELRERRASYEQELRTLQAKGVTAELLPAFDPGGGDGYNRTRPPNPACPECFGDGVERPYPKDTRALSPTAAALYAGVKVTREGLEIKMHSKEKALELYGKHLGMFIDKHEHSGPNGTALPAPQFIIQPVLPKAKE